MLQRQTLPSASPIDRDSVGRDFRDNRTGRIEIECAADGLGIVSAVAVGDHRDVAGGAADGHDQSQIGPAGFINGYRTRGGGDQLGCRGRRRGVHQRTTQGAGGIDFGQRGGLVGGEFRGRGGGPADRRGGRQGGDGPVHHANDRCNDCEETDGKGAGQEG